MTLRLGTNPDLQVLAVGGIQNAERVVNVTVGTCRHVRDSLTVDDPRALLFAHTEARDTTTRGAAERGFWLS